MPVKLICQSCGKEFKVPPCRKKTAKYCSPGCFYKENRRENNCNWKGGKYKDKRGYVLIYKPNHPDVQKTGYMFEHRIVMEKHLGRRLTKDERVHHINGKREDNRIENLQLFNNESEHTKQYHLDSLPHPPVPKRGDYLNCDYCGEKIYRTKGQQKNKIHFYCSYECMDKYRAENGFESHPSKKK